VVLLVVVLVVVEVVVVVVVVLVVVVGVGAAHNPDAQTPLQHWWFPVQVARFGLQLALLGSAPALGVATRSAPPVARSRRSIGAIRVERRFSRRIVESSVVVFRHRPERSARPTEAGRPFSAG